MSSLFSKPKMPEIEDPTPMPDEEQARKAARRGVARETKRQGFASTILSAGRGETLGG